VIVAQFGGVPVTWKFEGPVRLQLVTPVTGSTGSPALGAYFAVTLTPYVPPWERSTSPVGVAPAPVQGIGDA
jgi:hypothetical protein